MKSALFYFLKSINTLDCLGIMNLLFLNCLQRLWFLVLILPQPWQVLNATETGSSLERASCHHLGTVPANETLKPIMSLSIMRCFADNKEPDNASLFAWEVLNDPFWNSEVLALGEA